MLKTMLWQGALAALLIGGAAAGYAQVRDTGYLAAPADAGKGDKDKTRAGKSHEAKSHEAKRYEGKTARAQRGESADRDGGDHD